MGTLKRIVQVCHLANIPISKRLVKEVATLKMSFILVTEETPVVERLIEVRRSGKQLFHIADASGVPAFDALIKVEARRNMCP